MTPAERYITADELAGALGVSRSTVKRWVRAGCPSETWGMRVRRFRLSEVQTWARGRPTTLMASNSPLDAANVHRHERRR
jgi:excisionase family DNA binding protein